MPSWVFPTAFATVFLGLWSAIGVRNTRHQIAATHTRRPNPSRDEFMGLMAPDCSPEAAAFLWETALFYLEPKLAPHPDDDLARDLPIDDGDWSMDWPRDWAKSQGFHESNLPDWPAGWPVTIRNFCRWLDMGRVA